MEPLRSVYYKNRGDLTQYEEEYRLRFASPATRHLGIDIKQVGRSVAHPAFFQYTEEIANLLCEISRASQEMQRACGELPPLALEQFRLESIVEEIQATNDIEGVKSTRREIHDSMRDVANGGKPKRFDSVLKRYLATTDGNFTPIKTSKELRELYDLFILEEVLLEDPKDAPDGQHFRKGPVSIYKASNKVIHRGLFPEEEIIKAMDKALSLLNDDKMPRLVAIAVFQYLFGYIHPFYNGNGRTSRFIASYYLSQEIDKYSSLRLSVTINNRKKQYYEMFDKTNDEHSRGELTYFVTEFLAMVLVTVKEAKALVESKHQQLERSRKMLQESLRASGTTDATTCGVYDVLLLAALFSGFGVTIEEMAKTLGVSRNTIYGRLAKIPKEQYTKDCEGRVHRYKLETLGKLTK